MFSVDELVGPAATLIVVPPNVGMLILPLVPLLTFRMCSFVVAAALFVALIVTAGLRIDMIALSLEDPPPGLFKCFFFEFDVAMILLPPTLTAPIRFEPALAYSSAVEPE